MGMTLSGTGNAQNPVEAVNWSDARAFCKRLNERYPAGPGVFRLPIEAEWERACRGETSGRFWFEGGIAQLGRYAWYSRNASGHTRPAGGLTPNSLGLHDMLGNVWEWCEDWYGPYPGAENSNTFMGQQLRVLRGGSFANHSSMMSCSSRSGTSPDAREKGVGFRVVMEAK
jgi:formylglycine-generating enzyme required for sulfatase activity